MSSSTDEPDSSDDAWRDIRRLVDEVALAARTVREPREFYGLFVDRAVRATGATAAIVWTRSGDGRFQPEFHRHVQRFQLAEDVRLQTLHARLIDAASQADRTTWVPAGAGETGSAADASRTGFLNRDHALSFTPLRLDADTFAILELAHPDADDPALQAACDEIVDALADSAAAWRRAIRLTELRNERDFAEACEQFSRRIHASLSLADTLAEAVNEFRLLASADRVSVALPDGQGWRIAAISGQEKVDPRTPFATTLKPLLAVVAPLSQSFWVRGASDDLPPELERPLNEFLDSSHAKTLAILPLATSPEDSQQATDLLGLLVVEWIVGAERADAPTRCERLVRHVASALQNSLEYDTLPGVGWLRWLRALTGTARQRRRRRLRIAAAIAIVVSLVLLLPIPFQITARGILRPANLREVFASADGEVAELHVRHEEPVDEGRRLITLHSPALDLERERLRGEVDTTTERLLAAESARLTDSGKKRDPDSAPTLSATEGELRRQLESLEAQLAIVEKQRAALVLTSPMKGVVLRSNLLELLESRPVRRGQSLLAVGQLEGDWQARIDIPDRSVGHVLYAQSRQETPLPVTFLLATSPGQKYAGRLASVDRVTNQDTDGEPTVRAIVEFDREPALDARPGATVVVKIACGRRPLAYVWFHELFEYLQSRLFL